MNRATWRDVVVDVCTVLVLFVAVLLKLWTMSSAAPWMVAVAAGRWGASTISKYAAAKAGAPPASRLSPPASSPPPALGASAAVAPVVLETPVVEDQEESPPSRPLPTSGIVLIIFAVGTAIARAMWHNRA